MFNIWFNFEGIFHISHLLDLVCCALGLSLRAGMVADVISAL